MRVWRDPQLPSGVTLDTPDPDDATNTLVFYGALGLAPDWIRKPLNKDGQGWVSACLFERVNANADSVAIAMRGANKALEPVDPLEDEVYPLEEGAFYGNYFAGGDEVDWNACGGRDQGLNSGGLLERDCAKPDPGNPGRRLCGFKYGGACFGEHNTGACKFEKEKLGGEGIKGGYYKECLDSATGKRDYKQAITTYVLAE